MNVNVDNLVNELKETFSNEWNKEVSVEKINDTYIKVRFNEVVLDVDFSNGRGCSVKEKNELSWKDLERIGKTLGIVGKYTKSM